MDVGEDWGCLLGWFPFSFIFVAPRCRGLPWSRAFLAPTEWVEVQGKDLCDHPGPRRPGSQRGLGLSKRAQSGGFGASWRGFGDFSSGLCAPGCLHVSARVSPGGKKQVRDCWARRLCPAGGSRSAWMGAPGHRDSALHHLHFEKGLWQGGGQTQGVRGFPHKLKGMRRDTFTPSGQSFLRTKRLIGPQSPDPLLR